MSTTLDATEEAQLHRVVDLIREVLGGDALAAALYGSAVAGGLHGRSDLDVLVVSARPSTEHERRRLIEGLQPMSGSRAVDGPARSLEVTIVARPDVVPWRYPPRLDFQYGDWLRADFMAGNFAPWDSLNADVAVLLTTARDASRPLLGPSVAELLDPVPRADLERAMVDVIPSLMADLSDDTANVLLTLARIWTTLATGTIAPKDVAADWVLARLPDGRRDGLGRARAVYLDQAPDAWDDVRARIRLDVAAIVAGIESLVELPDSSR